MILTTQRSLTIWDTEDKLLPELRNVVLWQSYATSDLDSIVSVPQLIEDNEVYLRSKYLALIYDLGEINLNGKRIVEHLELRPGFSYWWMTLLTEKSNFAKSPQINNLIKLMAFKEWFKGKGYQHIILTSSNANLAEAMQLLASELGISFEWKENEQQSTKEGLVKKIYNRLPCFLQAFVWLLHNLISRWPLKGVGVNEWKKTEAKTTFITYLFNLVPDAVKDGHFESRYWTALPQVLDDNQVESNWLHIYVENDLLPNAALARDKIKQFNQSHEGSQVHVTTHSFLSIGLIFVVLSDWYKLFRLKKLLQVPLQKNSSIYWPLIKEDYIDSMVGSIAMSNLLFLNLFQVAMKNVPTQRIGNYLQENQGWEFGFIYAWRAAKHENNLVGIPHAPSKFWDLRYYFDQRSYVQSDRYSLPLPDCIGMNGEAAKKMYLNGGYPKNELVELEALRYLHLNKAAKHYAKSTASRVGVKTLLILGDYTKESTRQQMELLQKAMQYIDTEIHYLVKPHPACPIMAEEYPEIRMDVTNEPIPTLLESCSQVYTSNMTSAAVDAYCAGIPVITALDPKSLNLSPLKGSSGVSFVSTPKELAKILNDIDQMREIKEQGKDYFYLDPDLPRWRELLVNNDKTDKQTGKKGIQ